jgi:competence protein ComEC
MTRATTQGLPYQENFMNQIFKYLIILLLFSSCTSLHQRGFPPEWKQLPTVPDLTSPPTETSTLSKSLKITVLNVGQGDSTLIVTPNGKTLLIDAGPNGKGREVILPYLQAHQITSLDAIIASHYHADHIGGIDEVIAGNDGELGTQDDLIPKIASYDRGGAPFENTPFYPEYLNAIQDHHLSLTTGDLIPIDPDVTIRCVAIGATVLNDPSTDLSQGGSELENSVSISLLIEYGNFRYLTSGDITGGGSPGGFQTLDVESPLAALVGEVTAVHVNHHGSLTSSNETFVNTLKPKVALINVGNGNEFGHPAQEVLERWHDAGTDLWLTEKGAGGFIAGENITNGAIEIETEGDGFRINGKVFGEE